MKMNVQGYGDHEKQTKNQRDMKKRIKHKKGAAQEDGREIFFWHEMLARK
jgi:hypothetical protein